MLWGFKILMLFMAVLHESILATVFALFPSIHPSLSQLSPFDQITACEHTAPYDVGSTHSSNLLLIYLLLFLKAKKVQNLMGMFLFPSFKGSQVLLAIKPHQISVKF